MPGLHQENRKNGVALFSLPMHKWVWSMTHIQYKTCLSHVSGCVDAEWNVKRDEILSLLLSHPADCREEKEDGTFTGAEELFGTTSESDTSTFHGFEDDELEEPATNSNGISKRHR